MPARSRDVPASGVDRAAADASAEELWAGISLLNRQLRLRRKTGGLAGLDALSFAEARVLWRIELEGPTTSASLARGEQVAPQSMGVIVGVLESRGFVVRGTSSADGRVSVLTITPAGVQAMRDRREALVTVLSHAIGAELAPEEAEILRAAGPLLARISLAIE